MTGFISGSSAVYQLAITNLFDQPQQLQGFASDEIWDSPSIKSVELLMGVDGFLSGGFVYVEIPQMITLQADSDSNNIFDTWWATMQAQQEPYIANATIYLKSLGLKWSLTRGFLTDYTPIPSVKKLIQPRKFGITWNSVSPAPI